MQLPAPCSWRCASPPPGEAIAAGGDDLPQIQVTTAADVLHFFGVTLSSNWLGFPAVAPRDYNGDEMLLVDLPIYIDWELHINGCPQVAPNPTQILQPRPLSGEAWFVGHHSQLELTDAPWFVVDNANYTTCAAGIGIEEPAPIPTGHVYPVSAAGSIRIRDVHGGTATDMRFVLRYTAGQDQYVLLCRWNRPQSYTHIATGLTVHASPGTAVPRPSPVSVTRPGGQTCGTYLMWSTVFIVEHVSADASQASPRFVDASDVVSFATYQGQTVRWGFDYEGGPAARNFHVNFAPFGSSSLAIDSADLAKLAQELGTSCSLTKTGVDERAAILDWFGMVTTGRDMPTGPNGETSPEYVFADAAQLERAIADPYGYRRNRAAQVSPAEWGQVKALYR